MHVNTGPIAGEKGASREVDLEGDAKSLRKIDPALEPQGQIHLRAKVTNIGSGFLLQGTVELPVRLTCTRCLDTFDTVLSTEFSERFRRVSGSGDARGTRDQDRTGAIVHGGLPGLNEGISDTEPEDDDEEPTQNVFSGDRIELDEFAREMLLLAVPMKRLCSPDCKGICPQCGKNRNLAACSCEPDTVDPRLSRLADLLRPQDE